MVASAIPVLFQSRSASKTSFGSIALMVAAELLKRMADVYASMQTYADCGIVNTHLTVGNDSRVVRKPFATWFERPGRFLFKFQTEEKGHLRVIHRNGGCTSLIEGGEEVEDLGLNMAVGAMTGISSGSSHTIPRLLMPSEVGGWSLENIEAASKQGEQDVDGVLCHIIVGRHHDKHEVKLWLEDHNFMIRQISEQSHFGHDRDLAIRDARLRAAGIPESLRPAFKRERAIDFEATTTTIYKPQKNPSLDLSVFELRSAKR
jgi:hypothetical protein